MIEVLDEVHEVVVDALVVGVDDPVQVREIPIQVDVVGIGTAGQKVFAALKDQYALTGQQICFVVVKVKQNFVKLEKTSI